MSRPPQREGSRRPRVPGWLLAALVAGCLATAAWLFWADARLDDAPKGKGAATTEHEVVDPLLEVPDDEHATDRSRRAASGEDRLDTGAEGVTTTETSSQDEGTDDEPLPPVFANLAGRSIALLPASADATGDDSRLVRVDGLRVPCSKESDADRIAAEVALLARVRKVLERAGAKVTWITAADGVAGCADARARELASSDLALVLRAGAAKGRVLPGRPTNATDAASRDASMDFAAQLAGTLDLAAPKQRLSSRDATLLANVGAIDLDGSGAVAYVEPAELSDEEADAFALAVGRAMALTLARAGASD